ncbi:MAG: DUF6364 family protein [Bifidobacteriaceae bacterium]|nr:DUF6364 family protein [Bifidobacteriaceae bacterium]
MAHVNLTLRLPELTVRHARVMAAERGTSVSRLVETLLARDADLEAGRQERWARQLERMRAGQSLRGPYLGREESHQR